MLTDELQTLVDHTSSTPQALATRWCARWPHPVATADAEAAISALLSGEASGIRFFFSDVRRAGVLLKLLELEASEEVLWALTDRATPRGHRSTLRSSTPPGRSTSRTAGAASKPPTGTDTP
jgi:hypothetical protein